MRDLNGLPPKAIAKATGLSLAVVYRAIAAKELPSLKIRRSIRVPEAAAEAWVRAGMRGVHEQTAA